MIRRVLAYAIACVLLLPVAMMAQVPAANFSANKTAGCSPVVVQFTDLSTNSPTSWYWDLGNGGSSTLQNPSASYITPGTYRIILTATNVHGSTNDTDYINVYTLPTVAFTSDTVSQCGSKTVSFTNQTVPGAGGSTTYLWDFGDGDSSTSVNPTHTYSYPGTFSVSLVAINSNGCTGSLTKTGYITVLPKPTAGFSAANPTSCTAPFLVNFTNSSSNGSSYAWSFGDGGTSTSANPSYIYTAAGSYNVRLITTGANGCKDTLTRSSYIGIGQVNANASFPSPLCVGAAITFTNTTTPAPGVSRLWSFGNSSTDTALNPTTVYSNPGTYTLTLIENYPNNCSDTFTQNITLYNSPSSNFTSADTLGCAVPFSANFTNLSTGATTYNWSFGNGTSTQTNPTNIYNALGTYTVSLLSTASTGCTSYTIKYDYIKIYDVAATIGTDGDTVCPNQTINFSSTKATQHTATNYKWDFGDGSSVLNCNCPTATHSYASTGTYTVTLIITTATGCTDTATRIIRVNTKPTSGFTGSPTTVCPDQSVSFTNSSSGATTYLWQFGDGFTIGTTNPLHAYNNSGTYTVSLIASNSGCKDTLTRTNYITVQLPRASFKDSSVCSNRLAYTFYDSSIGANTYSWDFGDGNTSTASGNVTHTYSTAGTYLVKLIVTNTGTGCTDTMAKFVNAKPVPLPTQFFADDSTVCKGTVITLIRNGNSDVTYKWMYGNQVNNTQNAEAAFLADTPGMYTAKLIVTDSLGCKDSLVKTNYVKVGGTTVNFTASVTNACKEVPVLFTNLSPVGGFAVASRFWDFGDGQQTLAGYDTVYHTYGNPGPYTVKLVITDANGCKDSLTKTSLLYVHKPTAQFYSDDTIVCVGDTVKLLNNSGGTSFTCFWQYGDGNTGTVLVPEHVYSAVGNYTVKLTVTDTFGCKDSMVRTDYIKVQKPTASFTLSDTFAACPPLTVYTTNTSTSSNTYAWTFGNNNQSTNTSPSVTYTYPGTYAIKLVATNIAGCKDSTSKNVTLNGPTGSLVYSPLSGCKPLTVQFTATSSSTNTYIWDMNNGYSQNTSTGSFSYTYTQAGKYVPTLILSDGGSCQVPLQKTDTVVVDEIIADFNYTTAGNLCNTDTVYFNDTVTYSLSGSISRAWNFGDGGTSTSPDPSHYYSAPGTYTVRLIISNGTGCIDTVTKTVTVRGLPAVVITAAADSICPGQPTGSQLTASGASTYSWTPATGLSCTNCANPMANPQANTTYIVTGTDTNGCMNADTVTIVIKPKPDVIVTGNSAICSSTATVLTASGASSYTWTPATGLTCTNCAAPVATPASNTTYTVIGTNTYGCKDTADITVTVLPRPTISAGSNKTICFGDTVSLVSSGATTFLWSPGATLSCTACDSTRAFPTATTTYTLIGTAANGCKDTTTVTVNVNPLPTVSAGVDKAICIGGNTTLNATGANSYTWTPATGLSCTNCASPTANPVATTVYIVNGTDGNGCRDTDTMTLTVNPLPNVTAGADKTVCVGFGVSLPAAGATSYTWTPSTGLSCTNCASPTATPNATTIYTVTGMDGNGCTDTGVVTVNVNPQPTVNGGTTQNICPGDTASLQATGALSYTWSPAAGLSCTNCANPKASPNATTTYTVIGTDGNGCKDTAQVTVNLNPVPVVSAGSNQAICLGDSITLTATGALSYTWSPATGLSCTNCTGPVAKPATTITYTVIGTNGSSCKDTAQVTVTVNPLPNVTAGGDKTVCVGFGVALNATGATTYAWTPATGLSCTNCSNPTATPNTTTIYTVTGTDGNGCKDTGVATVNVNPQPTVSGGPVQNICPGDTVTLTATGALSYTWSPAAGLTCTSCPAPKASPNTTTTYTVIGTDGNGCKDTAQVTVNLNTVPVVSAGSSVAICIGNSIGLSATGAASYTWSPATGLSCTNCSNPTANPTTTTTYTVIGINGSSCKDTAQVTVTVNPLPNVSAGSDNTICVGFGVTLNATGATSYTWTPSTGLSCTNCGAPTATPVTTTTYTVTGMDANGCIDTGVVKVNVNPQPTVSAGANQNICPGDSATLNATGAISYAWSPSTGLSNTGIANPKASPNTTTTYTVIGTDGNGCKDTAQVTVNLNTVPVVNPGSNVAICTGNSTTLAATGAGSYTWSPATGLSCTNCASPVANPTTTTTYTVIGINGSSCKDTAQVTVTVNPLPNVSAGTDKTICIGFGVGLQATGANTYTWTPATGLSCSNCANPTATPVVTTTYTVTGTDGNGCTDTGVVKVNVNPQPIVGAGANQAICIYDSAQLQATGASTYAWSPATGLSCTACVNPKASPATTTTYTVIGTDGNGCKDTATVNVNVNTQPNVSAGSNVAICSGNSTVLTASGATSYSWSPGTGLSCTACTSPTANPTTTTTYTVVGTIGTGCKDTAQVTVTVNPLPNVNAGANQGICFKDSAQLQATGAATYTWSPATGLSNTGIANPKASPATTTVYTVTGTDGNGCVKTANVTVTIKPLPVVSAGNDTAICLGSLAQLNATGADTFTWTPITGLSCSVCPSPTAGPSGTTQYIVRGKSTNGCSAEDTVIVVVNPLPNVTASPSTSICSGDSVQLVPTGAITYIWSPATKLSCTACTSPYAKPDATITYTVTGTDAKGCKDTGHVTITVKPLPDLSVFAARSPICEGDTTQINLYGAPNATWNPATGLSCNPCVNPVASPVITTTYVATGILNGCTDTAWVTIKVNPKPPVSAGPDLGFCIGASDTLFATGAISYTWSPSANLSCTNCADPVASPTSTATYTVTGTDANGCTNKDNVVVTVFPLPLVSAGNDISFCEGDSVQLNATGASQYEWSPPNGLSCLTCQSPRAITPDVATYTVIGTDINGCINSDNVTITAILKKAVSYSIGDTICQGETVTLTASGGSNYNWYPADGLSDPQGATTTASPQVTTRYRVIIKQGDCFADTGYANILVYQLPTIDAGPDQTLRGPNKVNIETRSTGVEKFEWSPTDYLGCTDCPNPSANPQKTTVYKVKVTSEEGCTAEDDVTVFVACGADQLFIANTFTPNNDGVNDLFFPQGKGLTEVKRFTIYSRWGEIIYDVQNIPLNDQSYGWNGTFKGDPLKPDVFVYIIRGVCDSGEPVEIKGDISLIR